MTMTTSQFYIAIGVLIALMLLPLFTVLIVRWRVPLTDTDDDSVFDSEPPMEFTTLSDFWQSTIPHLRELRDRLTKAAIAVAVGTAFGFWLVNDSWLLGARLPSIIAQHFATGFTLQTTGVAEAFTVYIRIAFVVGFALALPVVAYQVVAFFIPALRPAEKRVLFIALPFIVELFIAGLAFGWFFTVPTAVQWLLTYGLDKDIVVVPKVDDFFNTVATLMFWNGIIFELPAVVYIVARIGFVTTDMLRKTRRYAFAVIVIVAAFITPTGDPYNLMLLALPMYVLYELGIQLSRLVPKREVVTVEGVSNVGS